MPMKRRIQLTKDFKQYVSDRRNLSIAYDAGYKAYERGEPMTAPLKDGVFKNQWYDGYIDAKYPDDKYDLKAKAETT